MENVTLSKDQKLITLTEEKYREYEEWRRKAESNTITIRKEENYNYITIDGNRYYLNECDTMECAIFELEWIINRNKDIVKKNNELLNSINENLNNLRDIRKDLDKNILTYEQEIQKVPKFIRKLFGVKI